MFLFSAEGNSSHVLSDADVKYLEINILMNSKLSNSLFVCLMVFNATFNTIPVMSRRSSSIGGENRRIQKKSPTCRKSLTNFIT
jgi:hypothetical protein